MDDDFEKQVKEKFNITCNRCGSENVSMSTDIYRIEYGEIEVVLTIECKSCGNKMEG